MPGLQNTVKILWALYSGFTVAVILGLIVAGMPVFDAVCHSFTALSTGGFSPYDASIEYYRLAGYRYYAAMDYVLVIGMALGGMNFLVHYRLWRGQWRAAGDNVL